jgi:UDP-N-acetylmuramate dehydrogenase
VTAAVIDALAERLESALPGRVVRDAPSAARTTYRCGGRFAVEIEVREEDDLRRASAALSGVPVEVLVVGRGSNLLVADAGFPGVAVVLAGPDAIEVDVAAHHARAGGAAALPVLARRSSAAGLAGLEFYVGIPGSVGGAVRMNAGGHGSETRDVLRSARVLDLATGEAATLDVGALGLGYRRSALGPGSVVVEAVFDGHPDSPASCEARVADVVRWRREHQPGGSNAGSVFRNPPGDAAGRLIDACGLKGLRVGGAVVSEKHANFFVADDGATADDVHRLLVEVRHRVARDAGVVLEPEVQLVSFGPLPPEGPVP